MRGAKASLVLVLVAAACSPLIGPESGDVGVEISLSKSTIAVGDTAEVQVIVTNLTSRRLLYPTGPCPLDIALTDSVGITALLTLPICIGPAPEALEPNEQRSTLLHFVGRAWVFQSAGSSAYTWSELAPGSYGIVASVGDFASFRSSSAKIELIPGAQ